MPTRALTAVTVKRLKPPTEGQTDYFDKGYPGLALRVSYGGAAAWVHFYRLHGKLHRMTLGRSPSMSLQQARDAWRAARELVDKGESPAHARPAISDSFASVAEEWFKRDQANNRSVVEIKRAIEYDVMPAWRGRMIATISRRDVIELLDAVADRGSPTMARRLHAHLHRLFRWSVGRGIIEANPMADLPKPGTSVARNRVLTDLELAKVWCAADEIGRPFGPAIKLLILTGARRGEIGALRWSEIEGDEIKLAGARTKNGEPHDVPLARAAIKIIKALPRITGEYVFTTNGRTPIRGWSKVKSILDAKTSIPEWRLHDLRRTVATGLQRIGISLQVIEEILGHTSGSRSGVVGVYQRHAFTNEKRAALDAWAHEVERIVSGKGRRA
jgi:integrase